MSRFQARLFEMQSFTGTPGTAQSLQFDLRGLPRGQRVSAFMLIADYAVQCQGGQASSDTHRLIAGAIASYDHQSEFFRLRSTGDGLFRLYQHMNGRSLQTQQVNIAQGGNTQWVRAVNVIPLADANAFSPNDTAVPAELINGTSLQVVTTGAPLQQLFQVNQGATLTGSVAYRLYACLIEGSGAVDPTPSAIDYEDWGGQSILLKPGTYSHLAIYRDLLQGGQYNINLDYDLTRVSWNLGGAPVLQSVLAYTTVLEYNRSSVAGGFVDNDKEQLEVNQAPFVPLFTPEAKYKLTGLPTTSSPDSIIQLTGNQTTFRILYRRFPEKTESMVRAAASAFGISQFQRTLKTASKMDVAAGANDAATVARRSKISKLIPGRLTDLSNVIKGR